MDELCHKCGRDCEGAGESRVMPDGRTVLLCDDCVHAEHEDDTAISQFPGELPD
jgi:ribosome-binding protein aMBF1 (putative translation factor)